MLIIATIGKHQTEQKTRKLILTGADILRFNFSRRTPEQNIEYVKIAKQVVTELHSDAKIMVDFPINKIRLGDFDAKNFSIREGEELTCKSASYSPDCNIFIPIDTGKIGEKVKENQIITVGDGEIALQVTDIIDSETIKVTAMNNGLLFYMRSLNIGETKKDEEIIEQYRKICENISEINPDYISYSYINKETNEKIKQLSCGKDKGIKVAIKIENKTAIDDIEEILQDPFYNMVIIDRGELGVNIPFEKLGIIQKHIVRLAKKYNKPVVVSTQILESTMNRFIPSRAEILGITNLVADGIKGMIFCRETGYYNTRPAYTVSVAKKIIAEAEKYIKNGN